MEKFKCYGISSYDSEGMKSSNPHSGIYEAKTTRTLDLNGGNPSCNQGGILILQRRSDDVTARYQQAYQIPEAVAECGDSAAPIVLAVFEGNGSRPSHKDPGISTDTDKMYTLNTTEVHGVIYRKPNGNGAKR